MSAGKFQSAIDYNTIFEILQIWYDINIPTVLDDTRQSSGDPHSGTPSIQAASVLSAGASRTNRICRRPPQKRISPTRTSDTRESPIECP